MTRLAGVDLGKTGCRAALTEAGAPGPVHEGPGAAGLAESDGTAAALGALWPVLTRALGHAAPDVLVVGAAGAEAAPAAARALAEELRRRLPGCTVAVTSDAVAAHAGALGGRPGTVLAVGTGSVALGIAGDGRVAQVDGWGPWLGDDGSGAWIGREAVRAVLRAADGRGPATRLTASARERFGDLATLPRAVAADGSVARTLASFTPDVLAAAEGGDPVALDVVDRALGCWSDLAAAAAASVGEDRIVLAGGLAGAALLRDRWTPPAGLVVEPAAGSPLDGALLLAARTDLPHEVRVLRLAPAPAGQPDAPEAAADAPAVPDVDVDVLATEQVRPDLTDLDDRGPAELVALMLEAEATVAGALAGARPGLTAAVELAGRALAAGGRLLYVRAGTPGRLAALDAAECPPTFGTAPDRVVAVLAGGTDAAAMAVEGAEDDAVAAVRDLTALTPGPHDLVVGISASGRTPYVLAALEAARAAGCGTVAVVNNPGSPAAAVADVAVELLTGPEVLGGSTRLKAGSAQKVTLNVLSTCAMVAAGKTYGAWMVDVVASNEKLRRRARRILREATGVGDDRALSVLEESGWRTKTALVALLAGVEVPEAARLLADASGRAREAVRLAGVRA